MIQKQHQVIRMPAEQTALWFILRQGRASSEARPCFYGIWPYGRAFIAIRDNEIAADAMGINTTKYKIMSFCI
jgi:hypothetical protein